MVDATQTGTATNVTYDELSKIPTSRDPFSLPITAAKTGFISETKTVTLYCGATIELDEITGILEQ
jgi:hypothetical protein